MIKHLIHYVYPHKGNNHRPHFFSGENVTIILLVLTLSFAVYASREYIRVLNESLTSAVIATVLAEKTNEVRTSSHLQQVEVDPELNKAAQEKANDMVTKGYFAHVSPDGKNPWYWLEKNRYNYSYAGENLAVHFDESADVVNAWVASPTHYENLINPAYTRVGYGIAEGTFNGARTTFVVQLFATPQQPTPITVDEPVERAPTSITAPVQSSTISLESFSPDLNSDLTESLETYTDSVPTSERVLAVEVTPDTSITPEESTQQYATATVSWYERNLAEPRGLLILLLISILSMTLILLALSFFAKMSIPHPDVLKGSAFLVGFTTIMLLVIYANISETIVPVDSQEASVISLQSLGN